MNPEINKTLTWDELAEAYDARHSSSRPARTLKMETVFEWAERQVDTFYVCPENGTIHHIMSQESK